MKNNKNLKWLLLILTHFCFVSAEAQLNVGEVFFDSDPGVGNGIPITIQQVESGYEYDSTISISSIATPLGMGPGLHNLYVRYANYNSANTYEWSQYEVFPFFVNASSGNNFIKAEYFFDTDPGIENGISILLNGNPDSVDFSGNISTNGLEPGAHMLHIRVQSATGFWSIYESKKIFINNSNGSNIVEAEYFFDTDPGIGNGVSISISGNADSSILIGNVNTTGLSYGEHLLYIRTKSILGEWSHYEKQKIKIESNGNLVEKVEYFFDTDPGIGNGMALTMAANGDTAIFNGNIQTTGLSSGTHTLYIRSMDIEGHWGLYEKQKFQILSEATMAEYFFDTDPGIGNGTAFTLSSSGDGVSEFSGAINTYPNLSYGPHKLYVRSKDNIGQWGLYDSLSIFINCKNPGLPTITQTTGFNACGEQGIILSTTSDSLYDAAYWNWYTGSCGATLIDTGLSIFVKPTDTTTYFIKGEGGCVMNAPCSNVQVNFNPSGLLDLKLYLQGYYIGSNELNTTLWNQNQLTCLDVCDTIIVELHNAIDYSLEASQKVILKTNGQARCQFESNLGLYFLVIKHRNNIETWSMNPILLNNEMSSYDFSTANTQAYGSNQIEVSSNVWALYSGDLNQDGIIDIFDYLDWDVDNKNFAAGYYASDINGDGSVDIFDFLIWDPNNQNFIGTIIP
ncbi:MAG: hypothetical protein R2831_11690 [Chitinophagaceae bacterium]